MSKVDTYVNLYQTQVSEENLSDSEMEEDLSSENGSTTTSCNNSNESSDPDEGFIVVSGKRRRKDRSQGPPAKQHTGLGNVSVVTPDGLGNVNNDPDG